MDPLKKELATPAAADDIPEECRPKPLAGDCIQCGGAMRNILGVMSPEGPLHNDCVVKYRLTHVERCVHCDRPLKESRVVLGGRKLHPDCLQDFKAKKPFVPRTKVGVLKKFAVGKSKGLFQSKNWKERFFVLSPEAHDDVLSSPPTSPRGGQGPAPIAAPTTTTGTLAYFESEDAMKQGKQPSGSIPLNREKSRLITKPMKHHHAEASNVSKDIVIVFWEDGQEFRLLVQCASWQEQAEWIDALTDYIRTVDSPDDNVEIA